MNKDNVMIIGDRDKNQKVLQLYNEQALVKKEHVIYIGEKKALKLDERDLPYDVITTPNGLKEAKTRLWLVEPSRNVLIALHHHMVETKQTYRMIIEGIDGQTFDANQIESLAFFVHVWSELGRVYGIRLTLAFNDGHVFTQKTPGALELLFDKTQHKLFTVIQPCTYAYLTKEQQQAIEALPDGQAYGVSGLRL